MSKLPLPEARPAISIDTRIGRYFNYEFDMDGFVAFMREQGMNDDQISTLSINDVRASDETKMAYAKNSLYDGGIPGGVYKQLTNAIYDYTYDHFLMNLQDETDETDICSVEAIEWIQAQMNDTVLHELGHGLYWIKRQKIEYLFAAGLSSAVIGLGGLAAKRMLGPEGFGLVSEVTGQRIEKLSKHALKTSGVMGGSVAAYLAVWTTDTYARKMMSRYGKWRYNNNDGDEQFARNFAIAHKDRQFVQITRRE